MNLKEFIIEIRKYTTTLFLSGILIGSNMIVFGQSTGDYRSNAATMNWSATASWQTWNGTNWVTATNYPTASNANVINIRNGHSVTVTIDNITVDQVVIELGGTLQIHNGLNNTASNTFTVADGPGDDLVNNGIIDVHSANGKFGTLLVNGQLKHNNITAASFTVDAGTTSNALINIVGSLKFSGESSIEGTGNFALNSGATIEVGSANGITASGNSNGNLRNTGTRTLNAASNYTYNGALAQIIGTGLPTNLTGKLTINNSNGVTLNAGNAKTIGNAGSVDLVNGTFVTNNALTMSATSVINRSGGSLTGNLQGTGTYNVNYTGNNKTTGSELSGTGLNIVNLNTTSNIVTLGGNVTLANLTITTGIFEIPSTFYVTVTGTVTNSGTLNILSSSSATGSLIANASSGSGLVDVQRYLPSTNWHVVSSPVVGNSGAFFAYSPNNIEMNGAMFAFAPYNESTDNWGPYPTNSNASDPYIVCKAYSTSIAGSSAGSVSFLGNGINTGTKNITLTKANYGWNGIGNPYTSAINVTTFLSENTGKFDPSYTGLYIWDQSISDYSIITTGTIPVGQGFIVHANNGGEVINFNRTQQLHSTGAVFKSAEISRPEIDLYVKTTDLQNKTVISFEEGSTIGLDQGFDVGKLKGNPNIALYTQLADRSSNVDFAIQSLPDAPFELRSIPIGLDLKKGGKITFTLETESFPEKAIVYLQDKGLNTLTQLNVDGGEYSVILPALTKGFGRFNLIVSDFNTNLVTTGIEKLSQSFLNVYTRDNQIFLDGQIDGNTTISVYGIDGKMWFQNRAVVANQNKIDGSSFPSGIYLVNINQSGKTQTYKVVLSK